MHQPTNSTKKLSVAVSVVSRFTTVVDVFKPASRAICLIARMILSGGQPAAFRSSTKSQTRGCTSRSVLASRGTAKNVSSSRRAAACIVTFPTGGKPCNYLEGCSRWHSGEPPRVKQTRSRSKELRHLCWRFARTRAWRVEFPISPPLSNLPANKAITSISE